MKVRGSIKSIGVHEAKTHFSKLLVRVGRGETILITSNGSPVAELRPPSTSTQTSNQKLLLALDEIRDEFKVQGVYYTSAEIRELIADGRP